MPLHIVQNDLTRMACDAVVNPTNERMIATGGLDLQIHRAAGPRLEEDCARIGYCPSGGVVRTRGYRLRARWVLHTAGPVWRGGDAGEEDTLRACYRACLAEAAALELDSVAFPVIAAGNCGFPLALALSVAVSEIRAFLREHETEVFLVVRDRAYFEVDRDRRARLRSFLERSGYPEEPEIGSTGMFDASIAPPSMEDESDASYEPEASEAQDVWEYRPFASHAVPSGSARPRPQAAKTSAAFRPDRELDESFTEMLLRLIDERGITDAECYKKANIDRKLFSKIRKNPRYRPSKPTAVAFAVALELSLAQTRELLMKAGFALSGSQRFDVIVEWFIREGIYDIDEINEMLFDYDQPLLGA